jgi:plastocyanin
VNHTADRTVCGEVQVSESLRIGAGGGLRDAVVSLEFDSAPAPAAGEAPAVMVRIRNCRFEPHSLLVPRGGEVFFRNEDRIRHRITATGPDGLPRFEITLPRRGVQISRRLDSTPRLVLGGVDRPWMSGVVWVTGHPFAGVTDAEGRFRLAGVPPGRHRLRAWHPALGETSAEVMARAGEETVVRLILPPGA